MNESTASVAQQPQPVKMSGGLFLTGTVIAVRTEEKEWEKVKYTQTTISISDGEQEATQRHRYRSAVVAEVTQLLEVLEEELPGLVVVVRACRDAIQQLVGQNEPRGQCDGHDASLSFVTVYITFSIGIVDIWPKKNIGWS